LRPSGQNLSCPSPSHGFAPPSEFSLFLAAVPRGSTASPGVSSPLAPWVREIHLSRGYLTRFVPPSGFLNLLTVSASPHFAALFHAADTLGFSLQSFPLSRSRYASRRPLPSCRSVTQDLPSEKGRPSIAVAFRALLPSRIRCLRFAVILSGCPLLSWDSSSLGFSLSSPWRVLPPPSPPALGSRSAEALRPPGLQGFTLRGARLVSEETADPSEVSHLVKLAIGWKGFQEPGL
jgi:hypothetical protein